MEQFASESSSCLACAMAGRSGCREKGAPEFRCTPQAHAHDAHATRTPTHTRGWRRSRSNWRPARLMLTPSKADLDVPLDTDIAKYHQGTNMAAPERVGPFPLAWDLIGTQFGSRQTL